MLSAARTALVLAALLPAAGTRAQGVPGNIVAGPAGSTELTVARDIAALAAGCGVSVSTNETAGSGENIRAVRDRRLTQFGAVQEDVLEYYRTLQGDDPELRRVVRGVRVAFPLYQAEVQVLARRDIARLADLGGRRVAVGVPGSGSRVTADLVLDLAGVRPAEKRAMPTPEALDALAAGSVDAVFVVDGVPSGLLASDRIDAQAFHLLPLTEPALTATYTPLTIPAGTYPFVPDPVPVVAVRTVLATFDYDPARNAYQAGSCRTVADVSHLILTRLERLRATGHPKWRDVDLSALPSDWSVAGCVLQGIDPAYAFTCRSPDGGVAQEGQPGTAANPNATYRQLVCDRIGC